VPVGTGDQVRAAIEEELRQRGSTLEFSVVSNPEFLKEGAAVADFMRPDRIVVGCDDERATLLMRSLYAPFVHNRDRVMVMDIRSAELTKYAANAMLATRISFMNELAQVAERVGADIESVRRGIGTDPRIGSQFLYAGTGYGGSCFPKDVKALAKSAMSVGVTTHVIDAVDTVNQRQKTVLIDKVVARLGADLAGKTFAVWGLAFKPNTDDMREAPSREVIAGLISRGARIQAYDPVAMAEAQRVLSHLESSVVFVDSAKAALAGADALVIVTEWKEFRTPDFDHMRAALKHPLVFDGRNLYDPKTIAGFGLEYHSIGRAPALPG
jgi:UDPglucose 6-dehydrogenase